MLLLLCYASFSLFYTHQTQGGMILQFHTTVCPSMKYYSTYEEIINQKPELVNKNDSAKQKKKNTRLSKHKKRIISQKNKEKAYLSALIEKKDTDYGNYVNDIVEFYNSKLKNIYSDYLSNTKNPVNLENYVIALNTLLDDEEMLTLKNKKHMYVTNSITKMIEGFELLIECMGIGTYDYLSVKMMSTLHDTVHLIK